MKVDLTPQQEATIREKVASGRYTSSSEVVREALQLLEERDREEKLRTALAIGLEDIARGDVVEWTPQLMSEVWREGREAHEAGEQPDPDVCP